MSSPPTTRPPFGSRRAATRQRLVAAASQLVIDKGFQASSLDEVSARAGLTKGAIYDNFDSKDALMAAVVMSWPNGVDAFPWPEGREGSLRERLARLGRAFALHLRTAQTEARIRAELTLYVVTRPAMRALLADHNADWMQKTEAHVARLVDPSELAVPLRSFAITIEGLMTGLLYSHFQVPEVVTEQTVVDAFLALAGTSTSHVRGPAG
jgi:AcrR family transcriptional regulator